MEFLLGAEVMYENHPEFGFHVYANSLGEMWINTLKLVCEKGLPSFDEGRERFAISNLRCKSFTQTLPDEIINKYSNVDNLRSIIDFNFKNDEIFDIDINPSFTISAKSYHKRIKDGKMLEFVIERLSTIPESKKAVIVFPTYEDYDAIIRNQQNDYLPCIVAVHFRLHPIDSSYILNTTFFARSMDIFQKGHGNFVTLSMLTNHVALKLNERLNKTIDIGYLDGIISDIHVYSDTITNARKVISRYTQANGDTQV